MFVKYKIRLDEFDSDYQSVIQSMRNDSREQAEGLAWAESGVINISNDSGDRWKIVIQGPLLEESSYTSTPRRTIIIEEENKIISYYYFKI